MTYEGARGVSGQYLASLGANAVIVGFVAGFGELLGYSLRLFSGYLADKTSRYWTILIIGYTVNLLAIPLLAFTGSWQAAAVLMILERVGKGIRTPVRDAMLAHGAQQLGAGWAFGLHEALDRIGAMIGPLILAAVLYLNGEYRTGFAILLIPAIISIAILLTARNVYPKPQNFEIESINFAVKGLNKTFWLYVISVSFIAAGYADFSLMAFHFIKQSTMNQAWIPITYALAMGVSGMAALVLGHWYDRKGFFVLLIVTLLSSLFAPLTFLGGIVEVLIGLCLWSIGLGAHESLMRAVISKMISPSRRGSAYGIFNAVFGIAWFLGSVFMGYLYETSMNSLILFSVITQIIAVFLLYLVKKQVNYICS